MPKVAKEKVVVSLTLPGDLYEWILAKQEARRQEARTSKHLRHKLARWYRRDHWSVQSYIRELLQRERAGEVLGLPSKKAATSQDSDTCQP